MKSSLTIKVLFALVAVVLVTAVALAEEEPAKEIKKTTAKEIKKMDGKELFKTQCKVCHAEGSAAGEYTPMSLIMDQWDEFFDETFVETHQEIPSFADADKKVTDILGKDLVKKLRKFCVDHAADSEQPMTCG